MSTPPFISLAANIHKCRVHVARHRRFWGQSVLCREPTFYPTSMPGTFYGNDDQVPPPPVVGHSSSYISYCTQEMWELSRVIDGDADQVLTEIFAFFFCLFLHLRDAVDLKIKPSRKNFRCWSLVIRGLNVLHYSTVNYRPAHKQASHN